MVSVCCVLLVGLVSLSACDLLECGYGGPGCGVPRLTICVDAPAPEQKFAGWVEYMSDTPAATATVKSVSTSTDDVLSVTVTQSGQLLEFETHHAGLGLISAVVEGWKGQSFTWSVEVTPDGGTPSDAGPSSAFTFLDGGVCHRRLLSLVP